MNVCIYTWRNGKLICFGLSHPRLHMHAFTKIQIHTAVIAWMIYVLSLLQLLEKLHDDVSRRQKIPSLKIWEASASIEENVLCFVLENGVTFHEKGNNNYCTDYLGSSQLSVMKEDCTAWWMRKEGNRNNNKEASIIHV